MFKNRKQENEQLRHAITEAFEDLKGYDADSDEYRKIVEQITALHAMKPKRVDRTAAATIGGNIAIAAAVISHERVAVITTKLFPFLKAMK